MHPILEELRAGGWAVAVHNDYRQQEQGMTFWLFTHPSGVWCKGEGRTDGAALEEARAQAAERLGAAGPGRAAPTSPVRLDPSFKALAEETALSILVRGKPVAVEKWSTWNWLAYLSRLSAKVLPECEEDKNKPSEVECVNMRRLLKWISPKETKQLFDYAVSNWRKLKKKYTITGQPAINVIWGFRKSLLGELRTGGYPEDQKLSRTHRRREIDPADVPKVGW